MAAVASSCGLVGTPQSDKTQTVLITSLTANQHRLWKGSRRPSIHLTHPHYLSLINVNNTHPSLSQSSKWTFFKRQRWKVNISMPRWPTGKWGNSSMHSNPRYLDQGWPTWGKYLRPWVARTVSVIWFNKRNITQHNTKQHNTTQNTTQHNTTHNTT
jgi:hypothetical protein